MTIAITNQAGILLRPATGQRLLIEQAAGWLVDDTLPGAKSYPIEFPLEPNERFLAGGYRPDAARPNMEFPVTVRLAGVLYRRCLLNYRVVDGKGSGYLKIDGGEVFAQLKKLTLQTALPDEIILTSFFLDPLQLKLKTIAQMKPGEFPCTFFPIRNEGFFETDLTADKLTGFVRQPYVNAWGQLSNGSYGFLMDSPTKKGYPISPQFYLVWILQRLFAWAGYALQGDWIADPEVQKLVVLNQTTTSGKLPDLFGNVSSVIAGQHLPKMQVGDFLKAIRQRFGLLYDFDSTLQTVTIRRFTKVVATAPIDLTRYMVGPYSIEDRPNNGYSLIDGIDSQDELYRDEAGNTLTPAGLKVGGTTADVGRLDIKLGISATQEVYEPAPMGGKWKVLTLRQPGNILDVAYKATDRYPDKPKLGETALQLKNDIALRIVSYRGMQQSSAGQVYPLGTVDVRDGRQVAIATQAVRLGGRNGTFRSELEDFYYFRDQSRPVIVPVDLPVAVAASLRFSRPIALKLSGQSLSVFLLEKLQAESPGVSGIMKCKLYALTLPSGLDQVLQVDSPLVYVELIQAISKQDYYPVVAGSGGYFTTNSLTVKLWIDAAKTQAAVVVNLPINIRMKRTYRQLDGSLAAPAAPYKEYGVTYLANGSSSLLDDNVMIDKLYQNSVDVSLSESYAQVAVLDPGDDYLIIS